MNAKGGNGANYARPVVGGASAVQDDGFQGGHAGHDGDGDQGNEGGLEVLGHGKSFRKVEGGKAAGAGLRPARLLSTTTARGKGG